MRAVIQRVFNASVSVSGQKVSQINRGFLILLGIKEGDSEKDADYIAGKCAALRIFEDENGKMNIPPSDVDGDFLVVSNFTLYGDTSRGKRPNFSSAARPEQASPLYDYFSDRLSYYAKKQVKTGIFGADMAIDISSDGPVTIFMDTDLIK